MQSNSDPLHEMADAEKTRNAMSNIGKLLSGAPGTQSALIQLGAGAPYSTGDQNESNG